MSVLCACAGVCRCVCVRNHSVMCWSLVQKLKQIEDLKQRQAEGQVLEQNQVSHGSHLVCPMFLRKVLCSMLACSSVALV